MTAKEKIAIILDCDKSKTIEYRKDCGEWLEANHTTIGMLLHDDSVEYRIKPKVEVWNNTDNLPPFPLALRKKSWAKGTYRLFNVINGYACSADCTDEDFKISFHELANGGEWETHDGKPCGRFSEASKPEEAQIILNQSNITTYMIALEILNSCHPIVNSKREDKLQHLLARLSNIKDKYEGFRLVEKIEYLAEVQLIVKVLIKPSKSVDSTTFEFDFSKPLRSATKINDVETNLLKLEFR